MRRLPDSILFVLGALALPVSARAAPRYHFDLPAAPLSRSIARIAAQARVTIVATDPSLLATSGPKLQLDGTLEAVLSRLLEKTMARAVRVSASSWRIVERPHKPAIVPPRPSAPALGDDLVVVGSKRHVMLSTYPASIVVVDGAALTKFGAAPDTGAIARMVPTLQSTHLGPGRDKLFIRGIADSSFNGSSAALVAVYVDDVRLNYSAPDPDLRLYDVGQVEVFEGPQGTLYGAGSMAGLVRITPRPPALDASAGETWLGGSSVAHGGLGGDLGGVLNVPLVHDVAALRLVGYAAHEGGYIDDATRGLKDVNATDTLGGRAMLRVQFTSRWRVDVGGIVQTIRNRDAQYADRGLPPLLRASAMAEPSANLFAAGSVTISGRVGGLDVTSTSALIDQRLRQSFRTDDGEEGGLYRQRDDIRLLSEELRVSSRRGAAISWTAGLSALDSRTDQMRTILLGGAVRSLGRARTALTELTVFGEMTMKLTRSLSLTAGGRATTVRLEGLANGALEKDVDAGVPGDSDPTFSGVRRESFAVPSLAISWIVAPGALVFARFSEGYRPGGQTAGGVIERFDADRIAGFEAGLRLRSIGGLPLTAQLSGATSTWRHIQADVLSPNGLPITQNIGDGVVRSLSANLSWKPIAWLEAKVAGTLAEGEVTGQDVTLDRVIRSSLPNVARDTFAASLNFTHGFGGGARLAGALSVNHVGHSVLGSDSLLSEIRQGGYWLTAAGVDIDLARTIVSLDIDNVLDSAANTFSFGRPSYEYDDRVVTPLRPRTIRLGIRRRF